jgi:hypothetical protein
MDLGIPIPEPVRKENGKNGGVVDGCGGGTYFVRISSSMIYGVA